MSRNELVSLASIYKICHTLSCDISEIMEFTNSVGEEIIFLFHNTIMAKVFNNKNKVEYGEELYTVTALAIKLLVEKQG